MPIVLSSMPMTFPRRMSPFVERIMCLGGLSFCILGRVSKRSNLALLTRIDDGSSGASSTALTRSLGTNPFSEKRVRNQTPSSSIFVTSTGMMSPVRR